MFIRIHSFIKSLIALPSDIAALPQNQPLAFSVGTVSMTALGDRILILEDKFRTGYECSQCDGAGKLTCPDCDGRGFIQFGDGPRMNCSHCVMGKVTCPECEGKGALIVAPDIAQRRPSTGRVVSCGLAVTTLAPGDTVLFSNFAGYAMDINGTPLRLLHEPEVLARVTGHLTVRRSRTDINPLPDSAQDTPNAVNQISHV